jgi:hypothetical protein
VHLNGTSILSLYSKQEDINKEDEQKRETEETKARWLQLRLKECIIVICYTKRLKDIIRAKQLLVGT